MGRSLRHQLFAAGFDLIAATRADRWLAPLARGQGLILTFHHVRPWTERAFAPNRLLEITPDFLDLTLSVLAERGIEVVALDDVPGRLAGGRAAPFVALTFDDGYRDNRVYAAPVLGRHAVPWTLFVTSGYARGEGRLWWIELERAVERLDRISLVPHGVPIEIESADPSAKQAAFDAIYRLLRAGPEERLRAVIAGLAEEAGLDPAALVREHCLSWDELSDLARSNPGLTIGAHTVSHPMLAKHDAAAAQAEIRLSKAEIEARLGRPVRHLAYPVGDPGSAGPREFALAREAGFVTAVTTRPGHLFADHAGHLHALPRVSVNGLHQSEAALRALLSGVPFLAWNRGRRLNVGPA